MRGSPIFDQTVTEDYTTASEDFDHLLFEFGLELDEDVSRSVSLESYARVNPQL